MGERMNNLKIATGGKDIEEAIKGKVLFPNAKLKEVWAEPVIQAALKEVIEIPTDIYVKEVNKCSEEYHTQKVKGLSGTCFEDAATVEFTIVDETNTHFLDPKKAINKKYHLVDYTLALEANMTGGKFNGYSPRGLKLLVTKLEEVKGGK